MQEIQMPCFGYSKKMIIVKNSGLFKKETKKIGISVYRQAEKEVTEKLEKYLEENSDQLKENIVLIFVEDSIEKLNITKAVEAIGGIICEFEIQKSAILEKRLSAICNAYKVNAEAGAIKFLIETSGTNMQELINEIRKLIEYVRRKSEQ